MDNAGDDADDDDGTGDGVFCSCLLSLQETRSGDISLMICLLTNEPLIYGHGGGEFSAGELKGHSSTILELIHFGQCPCRR